MKNKAQQQAGTHDINREAILSQLKAHRDELEEMGVRYLAVFGSVARDNASLDSDVDILIDLEHPAGLLKLGHIHNYLAALLGREVDVVPRESVRPELEDTISRAAVRVF